ncbi:unnamed protein product [Rhizophagus irregularis]|nr:unnamed protein product [Rhizophagus irregularis]
MSARRPILQQTLCCISAVVVAGDYYTSRSSSSKKGKDKWVRYIPNITHNTPLPGHERSKPSRRRSEDHVDLREYRKSNDRSNNNNNNNSEAEHNQLSRNTFFFL